MKTFKLLSQLIFSTLLLSCSNKDDDNDLKFNTSFLKQTNWEGTLTFTTSDVKYTIGILFITEDRGEYEAQDHISGNSVSWKQFSYVVDGKLLTIDYAYASGMLSGDWLLTEISSDRMILKQGIYSDSRVHILDLKRTY